MDVLPTPQSTQAHDPEYLIHNAYNFSWLLCARSASHIFVGQPNQNYGRTTHSAEHPGTRPRIPDTQRIYFPMAPLRQISLAHFRGTA